MLKFQKYTKSQIFGFFDRSSPNTRANLKATFVDCLNPEKKKKICQTGALEGKQVILANASFAA